jgi:hypothetical protein
VTVEVRETQHTIKNVGQKEREVGEHFCINTKVTRVILILYLVDTVK